MLALKGRSGGVPISSPRHGNADRVILELNMIEPSDDLDDRPSLCKRKDFLEIEPEAQSHPNRTYYYRKHQDTDKVIDACSKKLQVR